MVLRLCASVTLLRPLPLRCCGEDTYTRPLARLSRGPAPAAIKANSGASGPTAEIARTYPHSRSASCATLGRADKTPRGNRPRPWSAGRRQKAHQVSGWSRREGNALPDHPEGHPTGRSTGTAGPLTVHAGRTGTSPEPPEHPNPTHHTFRPGQPIVCAPRNTTSLGSPSGHTSCPSGSRRKSFRGTELDEACGRCRTQPTPSRGNNAFTTAVSEVRTLSGTESCWARCAP
jgi:hypothetical protein